MGVRGTFTDDDACTAMEVFAPRPDGPDAYRRAYPDAGPEEPRGNHVLGCHLPHAVASAGEANAEAGGDTFLFELCCPTEHSGRVTALDVPLAFVTLDSSTGRLFFGDHPAADALAVSHELHQAWVGFITAGEPGWPTVRDRSASDPSLGGTLRHHRLSGGEVTADLARPSTDSFTLV